MDNMIGQRIKERRKELHITQKQIEGACGISSGNLSGIETGRYLPSAIALIELAKKLDCSIDWILTGKSSISKNPEIVDFKENSDEKRLIDFYHQMSEEDQEDIMLIAEMKVNKRKRKSNVKSSLLESNDRASETA